MVELHDVTGIERKARRRQPERRGLAADPFLDQRPAAAPIGLAGDGGDGEALGGDAQRLAGGAPRLDGHRVVITFRVQHLPLQRLRQLGLLGAHQLDHLAVGTLADREIIERQRHHRPPVRAAGSGLRPRSRPRRSRTAAPAARSRRAGFPVRRSGSRARRRRARMRRSGSPAARRGGRARAPSSRARPSRARPFSQCPSRQLSASVQTSLRAGNAG